jgi:hypothetical protein
MLAAGSAAFDRKPTISPRALAKPKITRDRTKLPGLAMSIACGASKEVDINWRILIQPQARMGFQTLCFHKVWIELYSGVCDQHGGVD